MPGVNWDPGDQEWWEQDPPEELMNSDKTYSKCPKCGGELVAKTGPYGKFYGCCNFPECKFSCGKDRYDPDTETELESRTQAGRPEISVCEARLLVELAMESVKGIDDGISIDGNVTTCSITFFEIKQSLKSTLSILSKCIAKLNSAI